MGDAARVLPAKPGELRSPDRPRKSVEAKAKHKRSRRGRSRILLEDYMLLVEGYRREPGNHAHASKLAKVSVPTARNTWNYGLGASYEFGQRPIKEIIAEEQTMARAELGRRYAAEQTAAEDRARREADPTGLASRELPASSAEAARRDAVDSRAAEAQLVRVARSNVVAMAGVTAKLLRGTVTFASNLSKRISEDKDMPIDKGVLLIKRIAEVTRTTAQAGDLVLDMERKLLGDSDRVPDESTMTMEQAAIEIRDAQDALDRAEALGLTVLDGGALPPPGQLPTWEHAPGGRDAPQEGPLVPDYESFEGEDEIGDPLEAPVVDMAPEQSDDGEVEELPADVDEAW
jgi:hypothetical protein